MNRFRQDGLTLLEVLIALLVLSLGMVGLGALLLTALTNVHSSSQYSVASALALDYEERLWYELATISATDPDSLTVANGCLSVEQIQAVASAMADHWNQEEEGWNWTTTGAKRFKVPGLGIRVEDEDITTTGVDNVDDEDTGLRWQKIESAIIHWDEGRFDVDGGEESAEVAIGLVCRPLFN